MKTRVLLSSIFFMADSGKRGRDKGREGGTKGGREGRREGGRGEAVRSFLQIEDRSSRHSRKGGREGGREGRTGGQGVADETVLVHLLQVGYRLAGILDGGKGGGGGEHIEDKEGIQSIY